MPYKLTYFDLRGRGETSRMLFTMADAEFEDTRISREEWASLKQKSPFGGLPILEVDGHTFSQSRTIERFLAQRFGLNGADEFERAKADMIVDCMEDFFKPLTKLYFETDEEEKENIRKKFAEEAMTTFLPKFEAMVTCDGGFLDCQVTWPDLVVFNGFDFPRALGATLDLDKFPKLKGVCEKVENHPKIAAWLKKRPDNPF